MQEVEGGRRVWGGGRAGKWRQRTFLSLFFSVVSSLPAFAAWRFSCLAVNCV